MPAWLVADLGTFGENKPALADTFTYFGERIRVAPSYSILDLVDLLEANEELDGSESGALVLVKQFMRQCVDPADFGRFWALARQHRQTTADLMAVAQAVVAADAGRPTQQSSGSADGLPSTDESSTVDSASPAGRQKHRLEQAGRPDLAQVVVLASQARATA